MSKYIWSAFADEYSDDIEKQVSVLKNNGIEYLELRHANGKNVSEFTNDDLIKIKAVLQSNGIKINSIGSPIGKILITDNLDEHYEKARRVFEIAKFFGAKNVRVFSFYIPDGKQPEDYEKEVFSAIERLIDIAEDYGVTLCHENEAKIYGESPEYCLRLLERFNGKMKCVFDMGNFVLDGYEPVKAYVMLKDYVEYFHIKDALYEGAIVPAGKGQAEIKTVLEMRKSERDEDTVITLEPHLQTFDGLNALVGKKFDNPYKYENQEQAFIDAIKCLREIL